MVTELAYFRSLEVTIENILVSQDGHFSICDWGIARRGPKNDVISSHKIYAKGAEIYIPPDKLFGADAKQNNLFKSDIYCSGLLFLVCCGLPQEYLREIIFNDENQHNEKISEFIKLYVEPKIQEIQYLISRLTDFNIELRFEVNQAMKWCSDSKIYQKYIPAKLNEINLLVEI